MFISSSHQFRSSTPELKSCSFFVFACESSKEVTFEQCFIVLTNDLCFLPFGVTIKKRKFFFAMHERVESSQENTVKVPPIDPVTGQVMTKRAIRRRIVKNWERKQKELLSDSHQVRSSNSDPPHREEAGTRNPAAEELDDTTPPPSVRAPSTTSFISAVATTHPLRNAAAVPVVSGRFLDSNGAPLFRLGSCLPNIDQRPPFEFLFRMPNSSSLETTTATPSVFQKPELGTEEEDERDDTAASRQRRSNCAVVDDAFLAALALRDRSGSEGGECDEDDRHSGVDGAAGSRNHGPSPRGRNNGGAHSPQAPSSKLPIPNLFAAYTNDDDDDDSNNRVMASPVEITFTARPSSEKIRVAADMSECVAASASR